MGERTPGGVCLESSGRVADTLMSEDAAISSRHGALEPDAGLRFAFRSIASFSFDRGRGAATARAALNLPQRQRVVFNIHHNLANSEPPHKSYA
jgi:hypothetical protein